MSIINEALKKTQSVLNNQKHPSNPTQKDSWIKIAMLIIVGGFFGCAIILGTLLLSDSNLSPSKSTKDTNKLPSTTQNMVAKEQIGSSSNLVLKGIMQTGDHYTALINTKIVSQGDTIRNKRILNITKDSVKIFDRGEVLILELNP